MRTFKIGICLLLVLAASSQAAFVAVLETGSDPLVKDKVSLADRQYLTNVLREQAVKELPASENFTIMTRENITAMLPPGKSIEDCEGSCLAETGKNIAADYVCQARVSRFNGSLTLSAELYETAGNKLIASFNGLGPNLNALLQLIIQKSPVFFHSIKENLGTVTQQSKPNNVTTAPVAAPPVQPAVTPQATQAAGYEYYSPSTKNKTAEKKADEPWPRARFFIHAGILDAGLGLKLRLSRQNGIYVTADARWISFNSNDFVHVPFLIFLGGNHVHFITGTSILIANSASHSSNVQIPLGLNCDIGRHFGIDALFFAPSNGSDGSITLDFRIVF